LDPDLLVLAALENDPADGVHGHLTSCAQCRAEVESLRQVADLGRQTHGLTDLPPAPEHVWQAIAAEALGAPPAAAPAKPARIAAWWRSWRVGLVAATAAVIAIVGTLFVTQGPRTPSAPRVIATAQLTVQDPAAAGASGRAELLDSGQLRITLTGMPRPSGYYEVWLYDGGQRMIGLGDAGPGNGSVTVSVPVTANLDDFRIVDISAQELGQQEHGQSMLQGKLGS
jgi:hypothetical protein